MNLKERISAFNLLGSKIDHLTTAEINVIHQQVASLNPWFVSESIDLSLAGISHFLKENRLNSWVSSYVLPEEKSKKVGLTMAGNIPLVGFHDYLCVLISGNQAIIKLSSQDSYLLPTLHAWLILLEPRFKDQVFFEDRLKNVDALIATGSDNTARYFEYYFRNIPHIIRKNRSSVGILMGEEETSHLKELGKDVFSYFGLGCRNISKLFIPEGYEFVRLFESWDGFKGIIEHHKYANNYDYQKSILLVNKVAHLDNGFVLITQNEQLVSPISVVYYETYTTQSDLKRRIKSQQNKIQCIVSANGWYEGSVPFGKAQTPELWDYADGADTMKFLSELN
jgi:hypothetical protein